MILKCYSEQFGYWSSLWHEMKLSYKQRSKQYHENVVHVKKNITIIKIED